MFKKVTRMTLFLKPTLLKYWNTYGCKTGTVCQNRDRHNALKRAEIPY